MFRWGRASVAYALVALGALAVGHGFDRGSLFQYREPWLPLSGVEAHAFSSLLGAAFAGAVVVGTRALVESTSWAKALHRDLRPMTEGLDAAGIAVIAALSSLAEELVFRGLLMPWLGTWGVWLQAVLFGLAHAQLSGPSRWVWVAWASVVGLVLGAMFGLTGSLLGPLLAHALVNGLNLLYLQSHDTAPPRNSLGGLLSDRRSPVPEPRPGVGDRRSPLPAGRRA
ncbi:MAG: CPBP family intramembrane metalloprotease [Myxococcales bacterium]|nr:MAG: CPBP family intramembrane metalloprotease [Myxococcales bacterium]